MKHNIIIWIQLIIKICKMLKSISKEPILQVAQIQFLCIMEMDILELHLIWFQLSMTCVNNLSQL